MRLIDADALHNVLRKKPRWVVRNGDKHNEGYTYDQVHFAIDDMPTIEERKTGRWMEDGIDKWKCSECGKGNNYAYSWSKKDGLKLQDYFCPNCGCKMEVENDNA